MAIVTFDPAPLIAQAGVFTVGFVDASARTAESLGSGTLASIGSIKGILTCGHVIRALDRPAGELGIVCFPARQGMLQRQVLRVGEDDSWSQWDGRDSPDGPDLGFLRLSSEIVGKLEAVASVLNLDQQAELFRASKAPGARRVAAKRVDRVFGVVAESSGQTDNVVTFHAYVSAGKLRALPGGSLQREVYRPVPGIGDAPPASWAGTSGGGVWRFFYNELNADAMPVDGYVPVGRRFRGVAYYQTSQPTPAKRRGLVCHGPEAIYGTVVPAVRDRWG